MLTKQMEAGNHFPSFSPEVESSGKVSSLGMVLFAGHGGHCALFFLALMRVHTHSAFTSTYVRCSFPAPSYMKAQRVVLEKGQEGWKNEPRTLPTS